MRGVREDSPGWAEPVYRSSRTLMRRIVLVFVVGRSVGLMLKALSLEARTRGKDRRRKLSPRLRLSLFSFLLSGQPSRSLLLSPYLSTTRHCVPLRQNPVYSLTLWIFRKRFAAPRASPLSRRASVKVCVISRKPNFPSTEITPVMRKCHWSSTEIFR